MENATKGLMIAGAILIAIVLIGIGVFLVSQAQGWITQGGQQFSDMEKSAFNSQFENYEGLQTGANVKALITKINTNNLQCAEDGTLNEKGISIVYSAASSTSIPNGVSVENVTTFDSTNTISIRTDINSGKRYKVSLSYSDSGLVDKVTIANSN